MTTFNQPATPTGIDLKDHLGNLLLFTVHSVEEDVQTSYGPASPVRADVAVLDGPNKGDTYPDCLIFPKVLIGSLRPYTGGGMVLGRLGQGVAKPGQSAPWVLEGSTADDQATAERYLAHVASQAPIASAAPIYDEEPF